MTRDLMAAREADGLKTVHSAANVSTHDFDGARPSVRYEVDGTAQELQCAFIAGCDGFHGVCRAGVPEGSITAYETVDICAATPQRKQGDDWPNQIHGVFGWWLIGVVRDSVARLHFWHWACG